MSSFAAEADGPIIEAAVLSTEGGRLLALPVLSFPEVQMQTRADGIDGTVYLFESRMDVLSDACTSEKKATEYISWSCAFSASYVARHHHMHFLPSNWVDSAGVEYPSQGGWGFGTDGGSGIGVDLGPIPPNFEARSDGRVLLSDASGFPVRAAISKTKWKEWPELASALKRWASRQVAYCREDVACNETTALLATPAVFSGEAHEYLLSDGRKIQYLVASSRAEFPGISKVLNKDRCGYGEETENERDTLEVSLWRIQDNDGATRLLRFQQSIWPWLQGEAELDDPCCDTQCSGGWNPEVFAVDGRVFAFGQYHGGTVAGYLFLEITSTELKLLGWYRWGS